MNDVKKLMLPLIFMALLTCCNDGHTSNPGSDTTGTRTTDPSTSEALVTSTVFCPTAEISDLGMKVMPQEETSWCWAACGQMVIKEVKSITIQQCDLAALSFGEREGSCCVGPTQDRPSRCLGGSWPDLKHYEIDFDSTRNNAPLPWDTIVNQLNCKKAPICVSWRRIDGTSHMAVISAYSMEGGSQLLYILDPEFGGAEGWWTYDEYLVGPPAVNPPHEPMYTHFRDLYNITKQ